MKVGLTTCDGFYGYFWSLYIDGTKIDYCVQFWGGSGVGRVQAYGIGFNHPYHVNVHFTNIDRYKCPFGTSTCSTEYWYPWTDGWQCEDILYDTVHIADDDIKVQEQ